MFLRKSFRRRKLLIFLSCFRSILKAENGPKEVLEMKEIRRRLALLAGALVLGALLAGCSSSISQEEATTIALEHAGVAKEDAVSLSVQQEYEDGRDIFEVKFSTQDTEYSYDVAQKDGEIINYNYGKTGAALSGDDGSSQTGDGQAQEEQAVQEEIDQTQSGIQQAQQDQSADESQAQAVEDAVDEETAVSIAMEHAGVTECSIHRVELDTEDGRQVYEVEFFAGNTEYDYTIDRETGEILSYDQDIEGWGLGNGQQNGCGNGNGRKNGQDNSAASASGPITLEEAVQLVLDRVPGASASDVQIEFERDDGKDIYEGEVTCNRTEHEFQIDASTGNFIEWSVDYQD